MGLFFGKLKYYGVRLAVALVSIYIALFLAAIVLWRMEPKQYLSEMYRDLYNVKDGRATLKPGYYRSFGEGSARGEVRVNSYGYRGHEPSPNPKWRVLLLGDSFTFGALLDQKETIDARMEAKEPGIEVDNLGVIGYNLPEQLAPLREWKLPANQAVYLFFYNDFEAPRELRLVNGYAVPRLRPDGAPISDEEARAMSEKMAKGSPDLHAFRLFSSVPLPRVRRVIRDAYERFRNRHSSVPTNWWPHEKEQTKLVPRSLGYTIEMRDIAAARNMGFQIAIIPGVEEVREGKHLPLVTEYIAGLKAAGIQVIDLLPKLSVNDYWSYDPHFNPKGAQIAADEIYKALKDSRLQVRR